MKDTKSLINFQKNNQAKFHLRLFINLIKIR